MEKRLIQGISRKLFAKAKPLFASFDGFLVQMCHFHQRKTITSYLTRNPRLDASKDLQKIMYGLTKTTLKHFTEKLAEWHTKYQSF